MLFDAHSKTSFSSSWQFWCYSCNRHRNYISFRHQVISFANPTFTERACASEQSRFHSKLIRLVRIRFWTFNKPKKFPQCYPGKWTEYPWNIFLWKKKNWKILWRNVTTNQRSIGLANALYTRSHRNHVHFTYYSSVECRFFFASSLWK